MLPPNPWRSSEHASACRSPFYVARVMLKSRSSKLAFSGVIVFTTALFVFAHDFLWCSDEAGDTVSKNADSARERGVWVASLQAVPSELSLPDRTVHINSVWVEHCSRQSQRFLAPAEQRLGGFHLCFTVAEGHIGRDHFFVPDDEGAGVDQCSWSHDTPTVYTADLDRPEAARDIRLSLISSWHEPRPKNICFIPQP
jgi:hypothetical protein